MSRKSLFYLYFRKSPLPFDFHRQWSSVWYLLVDFFSKDLFFVCHFLPYNLVVIPSFLYNCIIVLSFVFITIHIIWKEEVTWKDLIQLSTSFLILIDYTRIYIRLFYKFVNIIFVSPIILHFFPFTGCEVNSNILLPWSSNVQSYLRLFLNYFESFARTIFQIVWFLSTFEEVGRFPCRYFSDIHCSKNCHFLTHKRRILVFESV